MLSQVVAISRPPDGAPDFFTGVEVVLQGAVRIRITCGTSGYARRACEEATKLWTAYVTSQSDPWQQVARNLYDNLKVHHTHSQQECKVVFVGDEHKLEVDLGESYSEASLYGDTCLALHGYEELMHTHA